MHIWSVFWRRLLRPIGVLVLCYHIGRIFPAYPYIFAIGSSPRTPIPRVNLFGLGVAKNDVGRHPVTAMMGQSNAAIQTAVAKSAAQSVEGSEGSN